MVVVLSLFYATCMVVGTSFWLSEGFELIEKHWVLSLAIWGGLVCLNMRVLKKLFDWLSRGAKRKGRKKAERKGKTLAGSAWADLRRTKAFEKFREKPFWVSLIVMAVCWLPYVVAFYPAILSPDPSNQIRQFFGIWNDYYEYVVMIPDGASITNHHPVLHTILLGGAAKLGVMMGNVNVGLFLYSCCQVAILAATLAWTIEFLRREGAGDKYTFLMLAVYSFVPMFPLYGMSVVKDTIFGCLVILYTVELYKMVKETKIEKRAGWRMVGVMILMMLFRHNGIHVILLSLPWLLIGKRGRRYRLSVAAILVGVVGFWGVYNKVVLPYFKVTPGSVREKLSIPFQQTARYVKKHEEEMTTEEKEAIDKVLGIETLAERYKGNISDPVKNGFNKYATEEDLKRYWEVWGEELLKDPKTYIEATVENTYGYIYPLKTNWYVYGEFDERLNDSGIDYHYNDWSRKMREGLLSFGQTFLYLPVVGLLSNIGANVWLVGLMVGYLGYKKKYREMIFLTPALALVLVCVASPVNCYFRYALPFVFASMLNFGLFWKEVMREGWRESRKEKEKK